MKAKLHGIFSPDLPAGKPDLPRSKDDFWLVFHADIGADDSPGSNALTFYITTPKWLKRYLKKNHHQWGRGLLIQKSFEWDAIENHVEEICKNTEADTWEEIVEILCRYFYYEYEAYQDYSSESNDP